MSHDEREFVLRGIHQGLIDAEKAIRTHPAKFVALYERGAQAFQEGQDGADEPPEINDLNATFDEIKLARRYLLSMAFISAWYGVQGNRARRDKAAHSAATLVSGLGLIPEAVFANFLEYETMWHQDLQRLGAGRLRELGCIHVLLVACFLVVIITLT